MFENAGAGENPFAGGIDPEQMKRLSEQLGASGIDPAMFQPLMASMQQAFSQAGDDGIAWDAAKRQALHLANQDGRAITTGAKADLDQAFALADLWLSEATTISELASPARPITRGEWVEQTLPVWQELAEPVATSMADGLIEALRAQSPEDMQQMLEGAGRMLRSIGGQMFAAQLGQVIGRLSREVVSGGDVGIPVMPAGTAAIVPQNFEDLGRGLEIPDDQLALYVAARELAHARLFRHAKWLRLQAIAQVTDFARGVDIDVERLEDLAARFDPENPEELKTALESGALLPEQSEAQKHALERLETQLALIEGWVDVVTAEATSRMPGGDRFTEVIRRRRAAGGPAEDALEALVGLRLRPRRLREAAAMWRAVTDAVGVEARDSLWDYPDMMPNGGDIDDPSALIARLEARARGEDPAPDDMDQALAQLLAEEADGGSPDGEGTGDGEPGSGDKPQA
ncbi:zinc-dependent metalloprotease [Microbacterium halophytorum]|uniref:zinc-dependent metalloprotease n=1 Tax=Microbacterium halophytorum TaxID=2067568 RepID=UPI000CFDBA47|nr:zinc-dependent metalloprotease [Microbacterium halophytorum]